ncbi:ribonuclease H-like domain-containing protein [Halococcoides cellulosivorans]|uniref:YprB ribonuclease H-like domain-containing protein n=1 Tax=Halococcoides cellulosivorans TaxID=1679096 RepID=A0A2R4X3S5_9EURY|nr:ribonuclease H-like domain-containing protein [Halococcoides cellulosivorans]AWB28439.1 hypothetical protein HARCEL1_12380 [Halococcoides cellulosivorans]
MTGRLGLTIYSNDALLKLDDAQFQDSIEYFDPDVVAIPSPHHERTVQRLAPPETDSIVLHRPRGTGPATSTSGSVALVHVSDIAALSALIALESENTFDPTGETYVLSDQLAVAIDPINLESRLDGIDAYRDAFPTSDLDGSYTHLTTEAHPTYHHQWGELTVRGVMPGATERLGRHQTDIAHLDLHADGTICAKARSADRFGLRAVKQVGRSRVTKLWEEGYRDRSDIARADIQDLSSPSGIGRPTAETMIASARAIVDGEVQRRSEATLPSAEPVFIDIETDGLTPTMVWLIGVLNRQGGESYMSFLARDPDEPGQAVEAFASWWSANAADRPLVAYNGRKFDIPILEEHIERHCPEHLDAFEDARVVDPYFWATVRDNAFLPGRTNRLEDVASGLGWDHDETGLSGATVGRRFQEWAADPSPETELDWERHERYCEDDVRALAHVYDAIDAPVRTERQTNASGSTPTNTAQGTLSDF